jgi:hypothetical protein
VLHPLVEQALGDVIAGWLRYDDARTGGIELAALADLRMQLEELRRRMHQARRALHPSDDELSEMAFAAFCDATDATVFIPYRSVTGTSYRCWCGARGEVPA